MTRSIELVAFDLGNVLCTVDEIPVSKHLSELSGKPWEEVHEIVFGQPRKNLFESDQLSFAAHANQAMRALGIKLDLSEFTELYDGVLTVLEEMIPIVTRVAESHRIALVSNTSEPHWYWAQRTLPFSHKFDPVITSYSVGAMKPNPAFYEALLTHSGVSAERILFVDDLVANIAGARDAGMNGHLFVGADSLEQDLRLFEII